MDWIELVRQFSPDGIWNFRRPHAFLCINTRIYTTDNDKANAFCVAQAVREEESLIAMVMILHN